MTCTVCGDKGILRLKYHGGEPDEFALCLCDAGLRWRRSTNAGRPTSPLWHVWAARERVPHERVGLMEEFFDVGELRRMFPGYIPEAPAASIAKTNTDVLLAASRTRKAKL